MLYALYAGTFCGNVLFYMHLLETVPKEGMFLANAAYMCLCLAGLAAYGFFHDRLGREPMVLRGMAAGCALGSAWLWLTDYGFALPLVLFAVPCGYLLGHIAYLAANRVPLPRHGRFIGTSLALCNLALCASLYLPGDWQLAPLLGIWGLCALLPEKAGEGSAAAQDFSPEEAAALQEHLPLAVLIVALLGLLFGLGDGLFLARIELDGEIFFYSRFFLVAGYFLAGILADRLPLYLPMLALAAKAVPLFVRAGDGAGIALLYYTDAFFTGALIILSIRLFFLIAPLTGRPRLWAGMGRGLEMPLSAAGALLGSLYLEQQGLSLIIACHAALLLLCALLFYRAMMIYAHAKKARPETEPLNFIFADGINYLTGPELAIENTHSLPLSDKMSLADLQQEYGLTERETEVLAAVLQGGSIADMAARLFVTERTVKFHIGNLLKKTGCRNQRELKDKMQAERIFP